MSETEEVKRLAVIAAEMTAADRPFMFLPHGGKLFRVKTGWEVEVLRTSGP